MSKSIEEVVRDKYGAIAESSLSSEHQGVHRIAEAFGYSAEEIASALDPETLELKPWDKTSGRISS